MPMSRSVFAMLHNRGPEKVWLVFPKVLLKMEEWSVATR